MEAPDYVLDPDGDVIITLRNFNAPFPILPYNETLFAWENVPENDTKNDQSTVGGEHPVEAVPPAAVEEVPPIEALAPEEIVGNSDNFWSTGGPSSPPPEPPPEPSVRLRVSSAHLRLVSPYFKKALDGPFKESHSTTDGLRYIDAEDWDIEAFLIVMRIIHGQNRLVPRNLDLEMLAKVAAVVDYYQCHEVLEPFAEIWHLRMKERPIPLTVSRDLILILFVSWVLRWPGEFKVATKMAQNQSTGPLSTMGLPIPERIISIIDKQRRDTLEKISCMLIDLRDRFRREPAECSEACSSMQLGALERRLRHQKELQFHSLSDKCLIGYSVALAKEATRQINTPGWCSTGYRHYHHCEFSLHPLLEKEILDLEKLEGLELNVLNPP